MVHKVKISDPVKMARIAEDFDEEIEVFWQKHVNEISDKDIVNLMTGWIDYQADKGGELEKKLNKIIDKEGEF